MRAPLSWLREYVTVDATAKQGVGAPLETVHFGYLKSLTKKGSDYEFRFDPALFLGRETANVAAAEDGAVEPGEPVPIVAGDQAAPWMPIRSGFWLRARNGVVRSLDQQYRP